MLFVSLNWVSDQMLCFGTVATYRHFDFDFDNSPWIHMSYTSLYRQFISQQKISKPLR